MEMLKTSIFQCLIEFAEGENITKKVIDDFISSLHYDILDNIDIERLTFGIDDEVEDAEAVEMIENKIEKIINEFFRG